MFYIKKNIYLSILLFIAVQWSSLFSLDSSNTFSLEGKDHLIQGYFVPPPTFSSPIVIAIQGSSCISILPWYQTLFTEVQKFGMGLIALEKQGISSDAIYQNIYHLNNDVRIRESDYLFCLEHLSCFFPNWKGPLVFLGESEGGSLVASIANQYSENTKAVILFATGGGLTAKEETLLAFKERLEIQNVSTEEINEYILSLEKQMDLMTENPSTEHFFLGNTYRWWASFLQLPKTSKVLEKLSCPVLLIHGAQDHNIPILSADIAAQSLLLQNKQFTYVRLGKENHYISHQEIWRLSHEWLSFVLLNTEASVQSILHQYRIKSFYDTGISNQEIIELYSFNRGEKEASASASKSSDGSIKVEGKITYRDDNNKYEVTGSGGVMQDKDGNRSTEGKVEVKKKWFQ